MLYYTYNKSIMNKKFFIPLITILIMLGAALGWILKPSPFQSHDNLYQITDIIDGDTFKLKDGTRVRILGIDAPEKGECYYQEAREALKGLIQNKIVKIEKDITDKDTYGRLLRHVFLVNTEHDNILVSDYLVSQGFAFDYYIPPDTRYRELLVQAREEAKRKNFGLWKDCDYPEDNLRSQDEQPTDPNCIIKGNISDKGFGKTYLILGCDNYDRTKIDSSRGEAYFCTEAEAIQAGFRKATNCP